MFSTMVLCIILLLLLVYLGSRKPKGYPPGPKWWPILGCAIELARLRKETGYMFRTCSALCKKYGPVVGLKVGIDRIVVLNDHESVRTMLTNEDCDGRPVGLLYEARTFGSRKGLVLVDGNLWIEQRKFVLRHLRDFGFGRQDMMMMIIQEESRSLVEHIKKLINDERNNQINESKIHCNNNEYDDGQIYKLIKRDKANELELMDKYGKSEEQLKSSDLYVDTDEYVQINQIDARPGTIIPMHNAFGITVLNTLWRMIAGKRFDVDDEKPIYLQEILTQVLTEIDMLGAPFGHFPLLRFIAPEISGYKSFVKIHQQLWDYLKDELDNHKATFTPGSPRDLMDVYLTVLNSKDYSNTFSESQLLAVCMDLFMAGSETTSKALSFCFLYLVLFPKVQRKAQEEIDKIIGRNRLPTLDDRTRMTYMNAIVLESFRMFIGRTLNIPHRAQRDTTILGHKIPKNTMLIVNFNRILMDESWSDPEDFRPERFIDESGNIITPAAYFPFSLGRHRCMGENLARNNTFVIATTLLQAFTFSIVSGEEPSIQDFVDGVTIGPKPFRVMVSLRS